VEKASHSGVSLSSQQRRKYQIIELWFRSPKRQNKTKSNNQSKKGWRGGSSCGVPASQEQSPEFKLQYYQK
jgi:hypothetical protein